MELMYIKQDRAHVSGNKEPIKERDSRYATRATFDNGHSRARVSPINY
jgi:hypothetical protein